jgi:hypothetical protein
VTHRQHLEEEAPVESIAFALLLSADLRDAAIELGCDGIAAAIADAGA